jgi:hypothetical protein
MIDHFDTLGSKALAEVHSGKHVSTRSRHAKSVKGEVYVKALEEIKKLKAEKKRLEDALGFQQRLNEYIWPRLNRLERQAPKKDTQIQKLEADKLTLQVENALLFLKNRELGGNFPVRPDAEDFELV